MTGHSIAKLAKTAEIKHRVVPVLAIRLTSAAIAVRRSCFLDVPCNTMTRGSVIYSVYCPLGLLRCSTASCGLSDEYKLHPTGD